jgi:Bacterial Ig-like domain (group 3)/FG-GAP-like repeat
MISKKLLCVLSVLVATAPAQAQTAQTIAFDAIPDHILGISPFEIAVQSSSRLPIGIVSTTPTICKVASGLVRLVSTGTCSLTASQQGNISYSAAVPVTRTFTVSLAKPSGTLKSSAKPLSVGETSESVVVGDFNRDGVPDLAIANFGGSNVAVLLGNGSGGFTPAAGSPFPVGTGPYSVVAGDFNGDGIQDFATANISGNNVTVLLGTISGGFSEAPGSPFEAGTGPNSLVVGDFNGDGIEDLATANVVSDNITVLLGNGSGGFTAAAPGPSPGGVFVAVGDFNGDGIQDLITINKPYSRVNVLLGNGSGAFTPATGSAFAAGGDPVSVVVGDFNRDGNQDLAIANLQGNVSVFLGNGSGGFTAAPGSPFTVIGNPASVVVGDFNGDGIQDLALAESDNASVGVLLGDGSGGFIAIERAQFFVGQQSPVSVAMGDFNGDGIEDLAAVGNAGLTVLLGSPAPTISTLSTSSPPTIAPGQSVPLALTVEDAVGALTPPTGTATFLDGTTVLGTASQTGSPYTFTAEGLGLGSHTLTASYGGDTLASSSSSNSITIQVKQTPQTITFGPLNNVRFGVAPFTIGADTSSGLTVGFASTTPSVCTVSTTTITLVAPGTCSITASQTGNSNYAAATPVTRTFLVSAGPPGIVSLSPNSGAGTQVTFKAAFSDSNGAADLSALLLQVNSVQSGANACYIYYQPSGNHLYLATNAGAAWITPALTPGAAGTSSNSQCTLNAASSSVTSAGNGMTLTVALTFSSTIVGTQNVYLYAAGISGENSGWVRGGTWTPNPTAGPPAIVSLSPNTGGGTTATFKAVYSDPNGAADLSELLLEVNAVQNSANACYIYYQPQGNHLYLANNAGSAWITPALTPGAAGTASNSQCTLNAGASSVGLAGNTLTLTLSLSFSNTFVGLKNLYIYAAGLSGQNSGWVKEGTWVSTPNAGPPAVVSLSPSAGAGSLVTFSAVYSDPNGAADLNEILLQINATQSGVNACYIYYQPQGNHLYLANNAGAWITPALTPGVTGSVANSQCELNAGSSSVTASGNNLTLNVALTFSSVVKGSPNLYLYAAGFSGQNSGWVKEGTWTPNPFAGPPAVVSLSPTSGEADTVTFKAVYSDPNGAADLNEILLQINTGQSPANACYVYYQPQGNHLYLANNAGVWITPALTPGVAGTASNSQCTLNAASSSVTMSGNNLTLNAALTFSGTVLGVRKIYLYGAGFSGQNSGWIWAGSWSPNFSAWHTSIVSLSPNSGTGSSVTFQAVYSDPAGAADLNYVELWVNTAAASGNGCNVYYQPQGNLLHLLTDSGGDSGLPALTPGVPATVSNSQCTLNAGLSSVTMSGNQLTLTVALTFTGSFTGTKNVYLFAGGLTEQTGTGFTIEGTWTP